MDMFYKDVYICVRGLKKMHLHIGKDSILNEDTEKHFTAKDVFLSFYFK